MSLREVAAHPRRQEGRGAHRDRRDAAGQVGRRPDARRRSACKQGSEAVLSISGADTTARAGAARQLHREVEDRARERADPRGRGGVVEAVRRRRSRPRSPTCSWSPTRPSVEQRRPGRREGPRRRRTRTTASSPPRAGPASSTRRRRTSRTAATSTRRRPGIKIPLPNVVVKLPNGKQNNIYGNAEDACSFVTMFHDIAERVGKNLNDANWANTVNNFGPIDGDEHRLRVAAHRQVRRRRHLRPRRVRPDDRRRRRLEARHARPRTSAAADASANGVGVPTRGQRRRFGVRRCCAGSRGRRCRGTTRRRAGCCARRAGVPSAITAPASMQ